MIILSLNPGSSSLKFALFDMSGGRSGQPVIRGEAERLGTEEAKLRVLSATCPPTETMLRHSGMAEAARSVMETVTQPGAGSLPANCRGIDAIGCRVVHGGDIEQPQRVSPEVLQRIRDLSELAPLHNPAAADLLEQVRASHPETPLVAVFDTAFHRTLPPVAYTYAVPEPLARRFGLRRYGFHGISHQFVSTELARLLGPPGRSRGDLRLVSCHLGSGASICAVRDGASLDTSMGFTPMEGLVMGTRSGDVDPGLILFLLSRGMSVGEVDEALNNQSGLKGVSGVSDDVRDIQAAAAGGDQRAALALQLFAYRAIKYIGAYAVALGGLDAIGFAGGVGENSAAVRRSVCSGLELLGVEIEDNTNEAATCPSAPKRISSAASRVEVWVVPTNEELQVARETARLLAPEP